MMTIQKIRMADCDRGTDDDGNYTDDGYQYVVCEDNDINRAVAYCDTIEEAERVLLMTPFERSKLTQKKGRYEMKTAELKKACVGVTEMALYNKALGCGEEIREALHSGDGCDGVTIVDDQSDRPWNQEWTICVIADVECEDGVQRIAYYHDGARDVLDDGTGVESCEEWGKAWDDMDGLVPSYLGLGDDE